MNSTARSINEKFAHLIFIPGFMRVSSIPALLGHGKHHIFVLYTTLLRCIYTIIVFVQQWKMLLQTTFGYGHHQDGVLRGAWVLADISLRFMRILRVYTVASVVAEYLFGLSPVANSHPFNFEKYIRYT